MKEELRDHQLELECIENVYEIAFGDQAIEKGYDHDEVLTKLREYSDNALKWEELENTEDWTKNN